MSRSQQGALYNTTSKEGGTAFGSAENDLTRAQEDIGNYEGQLASYAAGNPYVPGGEFQTSQNRVLSDTANATANAGQAMVQGMARRTGQNPAAANAAGEAIAEKSQRTLGADQARANEQRIGDEANYNRSVLQASAVPVGMESQLAGDQSRLYGTAMGTSESAARTPSFWDVTGDAFGNALGKTLGGGFMRPGEG